MKDCVRCNTPKLLAEFAHKDSSHLRNWCKSCDAERMRRQRGKGIAIGVGRASEYLGRMLKVAEYYSW